MRWRASKSLYATIDFPVTTWLTWHKKWVCQQTLLQFYYELRLGVDDADLHPPCFIGIWLAEVALCGCHFLISAALLMQVSLCYWVRSCRFSVPQWSPGFLTPWQAGCSLSIRAGVLSDVVVSGASRGNVLSPFLFTLYTTDCLSNSEPRHLQKFSDDSAFVTCLREGEEGEYRTLIDNFVEWTEQNHPRLNVR